MKVFFDVDGVLIEGWHVDEALRKPWDATLEADLGVDRRAFQNLFFGTFGDQSSSLMYECLTGRCDLKDALGKVLPKLGYKGSGEAFIRYWLEKDSNVNSEVLRLVQKIREINGVQLFIATGQEHYRADYLWNDLGFSRYFDGMFYSAKIGFPKKDRRFFEAINRALNIAPEEKPLFFDDQPEIVKLAGNAGWDATTFRSVKDIQDHPFLSHLWRA